MRAVLTRVSSAEVRVDGETAGKIGRGYLVLLGVHKDDEEGDAVKLAEKVCKILVISQFTLFADVKSRRPGFTEAARPDKAVPLYEKFMEECAGRGFHIEHGVFGADMKVESVNDGPVTIIFDTREL